MFAYHRKAQIDKEPKKEYNPHVSKREGVEHEIL